MSQSRRDGLRPGLILPRRLKPGAVFGIAAPASPFERGLLERGIQVLRALGFEVVFSGHLFATRGHLAGTDEERAADFNSLFDNPEVDAVICARGGYGSLRILPLIDFQRIASHPKAIVGFSDITALLSGIYSRCGLAVFHGPMLTTLAVATETTQRSLLNTLSAEGELTLSCANAVTLRGGRAAGPVCGGNLTTLCHLLGTPYAPDFRRHILFLEDCGEAPYRIDRMLTQMKLSGCFEHLRGLLLGSFENCGPAEAVRAVVEDVLGDMGFPILAGLDAGHREPNLTLPFGIRARLDAEGRTLAFDFPPAG
jgi:muramoyltetrapeptide carboxypeptidase